MRHLIYISIFLIVPICVFAQDSLRVTVPVAYVSVNGDSQIQFSSDSVNLHWNQSNSIGALLRGQANFISRSYGGRGTAVTASGQGLSANQFTVTWNGFEINSPTLGTVDLGILSTSMFSSLRLNQHSFGVSPAQSSGAGGWLELKSENSSVQSLDLQLSANSIGNQSMALSAPYQIRGLQLVSRINYVHALNEFTYTDDHRRTFHPESNSWEHPELQQDHNNHEMLSVIQGLSLDLNKWLLDAQVWYQTSQSNLPEIKGSFGQSFAEQSDSSFRSTVSLRGRLRGIESHFSVAWFEESQRYTDRQTENGELLINSKIRSKIGSARAHFKGKWKGFSIGSVSNFTYKTAETGNYKSHLNPEINIWSQSVQVGTSKGNTTIDVNARYDLVLGQQTQPTFDFLAFQKLGHNEKFRLRIAYSRMFRLPTFNELYWQSDEQRKLNSEVGDKATIGFDGDLKVGKTAVRFDAYLWYTQMEEMIQWQTIDAVSTPINTGAYAAGNAGGKVEVEHGTKVKKLFGYQLNALKYFDDPFWLNNSNRTNHPQWRQTFSLSLEFKNWSMFEQSTYRKNDLFPGAESNTSHEAVIIHDIGIGYLYARNRQTIQAQILIENIQNTPNHFLRAYAMPGRVLSLNLILKRTPKSN